MAKKQYLDLAGLTTYDEEIKAHISEIASGKANSSHNHAISDVTNLQSSLDGKQATITGGASTITSSNLTASRALVSDSSGKVAVSAVTSTELGYLDGVTSNVQAQLDQMQSDIESIPQSDWNQNDSTKLDYIENRPFYAEDPVETVILQSATITLNDGYASFAITQPLEVGQEYVVVLDGVRNNQTCKYHDEYAMSYIGNASIIGSDEDTGESFFIAPTNSETELGFMTTGSATQHTISIISITSEIHKIEEKYLPDDIAKGAGLKVAGASFTIDDTEVVAVTGAEIFNDYENNIATGEYSHAEGYETIASGYHSHAEGWSTKASGVRSHAEGHLTIASGEVSHAEGQQTQALSSCTHAEGRHTIASSPYQHVQGKFNVEDPDYVYAHIVGNGTGTSARSNAHTLDWDGNAWFAGNVYVGGTSQDNATSLASVATMTAAEYEALETYDEATLYNISDAEEPEVMDLTSDQTATGVKTFSNGIIIGDNGVHLTYDSTEGAMRFTFLSAETSEEV